MRILRRAAVLILLGLTLGTPRAGASPPRPAASTTQHVLHYLAGFLSGFWLKTGCIVDPNGRCALDTQTRNPDGGCTIDPDGRCTPGVQTQSTDTGCTMDPLGRCAPGH
ncbi:MAG TPA: hypothetical protein VGS07_10515 [Thermoanaerobaculia bacterium]|nr:hypothetical protein [Thermoanaerobaculia bacterium]